MLNFPTQLLGVKDKGHAAQGQGRGDSPASLALLSEKYRIVFSLDSDQWEPI